MVVQLIGATRTRAGLTVNAKLDKKQFPTKVKVATEEMVSVNPALNVFHGKGTTQLADEPSELENVNVLYLMLINRP